MGNKINYNGHEYNGSIVNDTGVGDFASNSGQKNLVGSNSEIFNDYRTAAVVDYVKRGNTAEGSYSTTMGSGNRNTGKCALVTGQYNTNSAQCSFVTGSGNTNNSAASYSIVAGNNNTNDAYQSIVVGYGNTVGSTAGESIVVGYMNNNSAPYSGIIGIENTNRADRLIIISNNLFTYLYIIISFIEIYY